MCKKIKYCVLCRACRQDCKTFERLTDCINFKDAPSMQEYWKIIREENMDLKRIANDYNLSLNTMYKMLHGEIDMTYKYHTVLLSRIEEVEEFDKCWDRFEVANG